MWSVCAGLGDYPQTREIYNTLKLTEAQRPSEVRQQFQAAHMPVDDAPADDAVRQSYNFAPGYHGLVYRADRGASDTGDASHEPAVKQEGATGDTGDTRYKLQAMQWGMPFFSPSTCPYSPTHPATGLVPFWTQRNPDYATKLKTINCRDDSLIEDRGMWTTMKKKKRCIIVAQGFFEWLKKNNGKDRLPHFTRRKDGQLMCFAGLWDCVQFEDSTDKLFTYSIITTDSNKQLSFLHDRMPVILENGSDAIRSWLDPAQTEWTQDLQSLLKPFPGQLECYQVNKDVGKVGNNSPSFLIPIDSAANKNNIANFFGSPKKAAKADQHRPSSMADAGETRATSNHIERTEDNAPLPGPATPEPQVGEQRKAIKRERSDQDATGSTADAQPSPKRSKPGASASPAQTAAKKQGTRSATSNGSTAKSPDKAAGSRKITSFFSNV